MGSFVSCVSMRDHFVRNMLNEWEERDNKIRSEQTLPENIIEIIDMQYINSGHRGHLLDIYYPENLEGPFPVIINIHGGGFLYGYKEMNKLFGYNMAKNGFIIFNINYRLAFSDTKIPGQIQDVIAAFNWIGNNLENYPANREKIYVIGESAGAYLAVMATLVSENQRLQKIFNVDRPNIKINALGIVSGFMELERKEIRYWGMRSMILEKGYEKQEYYKNLILNDLPEIMSLPPIFLTTNEDDELNFMSEYFENILRENHLKYQYYYARRSGRKLGHMFNTFNLDWEESIELNNMMLEYMLRH